MEIQVLAWQVTVFIIDIMSIIIIRQQIVVMMVTLLDRFYCFHDCSTVYLLDNRLLS